MALNQGNKMDVVGEAILNEQDALELVKLQILFRGAGGSRDGSLRNRGEKGGAEDRRLKVRWAGNRQVLVAFVDRHFKERCGGPRRGGKYKRGVVSRKLLRRGADEKPKA